MTTSPEIDKLAAALAEARKKFKPILRTKEVTVRPKDPSKASYKFKYAPFEEMVEATALPLAEQGLSVLTSAEDGRLVARLIHSSGQWIEGSVPMPDLSNATPQELGSHMAYRTRYVYRQLLTLPADEDDDGNIAEGNEFQVTKERTSKPVPPKPSPLEVQKAGCMAVFNQLGMTNDITREALRVKLMGDIKFNPNSVTDWVQLLGLLQAHRDTINPARELEV